MSAKLRSGLPALAATGGVILAGLGAGGCAHPVTVRDATVQVALNEYRLTPSSIRLRARSLTIVATNVGRLTHNLVVSHDGVTVATIHPLSPGQSGQVTVALAPGSYLVGSTLESDEALGLYGHIRVSG